MADEQNPNNETPNTTAAPATQPGTGQPQITPEIQALIDAAKADAAQQAKNAAWAEARRTFEAKQKQAGGGQQQPAQPSNQPQQPQGQQVDVRSEIARMRAFERAAAQYGLTPAALEILEGDFNTANPTDPADWVKQRATAFGWKAAGAATPATPAPEPPAAKTPPGPPVTGSGAPANPTSAVDDTTPILRMSEADRLALQRKIGPAAYVERMRKEFRENNVRVRFGR